MNEPTINGQIRNIIMAIAAVVSSFNLMSEEILSHATAVVMAAVTLYWSYKDPGARNAVGMLVRRLIQSVAPLLVAVGYITPEQSMPIMSLALLAASMLDFAEKKK